MKLKKCLIVLGAAVLSVCMLALTACTGETIAYKAVEGEAEQKTAIKGFVETVDTDSLLAGYQLAANVKATNEKLDLDATINGKILLGDLSAADETAINKIKASVQMTGKGVTKINEETVTSHADMQLYINEGTAYSYSKTWENEETPVIEKESMPLSAIVEEIMGMIGGGMLPMAANATPANPEIDEMLEQIMPFVTKVEIGGEDGKAKGLRVTAKVEIEANPVLYTQAVDLDLTFEVRINSDGVLSSVSVSASGTAEGTEITELSVSLSEFSGKIEFPDDLDTYEEVA